MYLLASTVYYTYLLFAVQMYQQHFQGKKTHTGKDFLLMYLDRIENLLQLSGHLTEKY